MHAVPPPPTPHPFSGGIVPTSAVCGQFWVTGKDVCEAAWAGGLSESPPFPSGACTRGERWMEGEVLGQRQSLCLAGRCLRGGRAFIPEDMSKHGLPRDGSGWSPRAPPFRVAAKIGQGHPGGARFLGRGDCELELLLQRAQESANPAGGRTPTPGSAPS